MRALLLGVATAVALIDCGTGAPARPAAEKTPSKSDDRIVAIDRELATLGDHPSGHRAGALFEEKGDRLLASSQRAAAKAAYLEAARAFNQSPEATNAPVIDSDRCRGKAAAITP